MAGFDYNPIRNTAIALVKKFGRKVPCSLMRAVEGTAPDATKPWRRGDPTFLEFKFIGIVSNLGFPKLGDPSTDADQDITVPGDLATTGAESDVLTLCGDPVLTDRIVTDSLQFGILGVHSIKPDDKTIIYKLRCRAWPLTMSKQSTQF